MKRILFVFAFFLVFSVQVHAGSIIGGAISAGAEAAASESIVAAILGTHAEVMLKWATQVADMATQIKHLYDQLEHMKISTERAANNLRGF